MFLHQYRRSQPSGLGKGVGSGVFCGRSLSLGFLRLHTRLLRRLRSEVAEIGRGCYDHAQLRVLSGYSGRIAALQLNSGRSHLLRSRSRSYTSIKYDPWSNPCTVLTTPRCLPCLDVSSPCTRYISYLVSFSPDLT